MTLNDVIVKVDDIKPNAFTSETKTGWVNEIEGLVQTEVMLLAPEEVIEYRYDRNADTELLAKPPHVKIYWAYLMAMIDFANGEYDKYENTMQVFNSFFLEYQAWYARTYRPADGEMVLRGYYLSAYGLAVKHGFAGTEEEWIESIRGMPGDPGPGVDMRFENGWIQWQRENSAVWNELLSLADIQGEVISQTLEAAENANQQAQAALEAAHGMEAEVEQVKTAAVQAAEQTASDRQAVEQANTEAQAARETAQQAAVETEDDRQAAEQARTDTEMLKDETTAAAQAAQTAQKAAEDARDQVQAAIPDGKFLPLAGGDMTGMLTVGQGNSKGINLGDGGHVGRKTTDAWQVLLGMVNGELLTGHTAIPMRIRGSLARPTYNGNDMALLADIPDSDIFVAVYNKTTYDELLEAYNAGKLLFVKNGIYYCPLWRVSESSVGTYFDFSSAYLENMDGDIMFPTLVLYSCASAGWQYLAKSIALSDDVPSTTEQWTFTLEDDSTVTKKVYVR